MTANVGSLDRIARLILGAALILLPFVTTWSLWSSSLAQFGIPAIGLILIVTAFIKFCPLYYLTGMRSCSAS